MDILAATLVRAVNEYSRGEVERALAELDAAEKIARQQGRGLPHVLVQRVTWLREVGGAARGQEAMRAAEAELSRAPESFDLDLLAMFRTEQGIVAMRGG